jgi:pimeloyl-ACP methyl ester carboxylesterase
MAGELFNSLMLNAVDEIIRRDPEYLSRQPVRTGRAAPDDSSHTQKQFAGAQALGERCMEFLRRANIPFDDTAVEADDVWQLLMASATDAEAAERGAVSLAPSVSLKKPIEHVLRDDYKERKSSSGARYFVRCRGRQPLVLINASGIPAAVWIHLLADESDHFRILLCESRASDLLAGGLLTDATAEMDAADAALAVQQEGFDKVDVLAWCNGHLAAIELTEKIAVDSVVLLSPSLFTCDARSATVYARKILGLLDVVRREPHMTSALCKYTLAQVNASAEDPSKSEFPIWSLPDRSRVLEIASPMSTAPSLTRYASRVASDATYPLRQKLAKLTNRLMVITGNDDHIAGDVTATELLASTRVKNTRIRMAAAGHYIQDLQYRYLRTLLESFLVDRSEPRPLARIAVVTSAT